jgi:hypothetical protein
MKLLVATFSFLAFTLIPAAPALADNSPSPLFPDLNRDPLYDSYTYQALRDITVDVAWNQAPLRIVLRDLTLIVRTTHPVHAAIDFQFSSSASPAARTQPITLQERGVPIFQLLEELARQAPFTIKIRQDLVLIVPAQSR